MRVPVWANLPLVALALRRSRDSCSRPGCRGPAVVLRYAAAPGREGTLFLPRQGTPCRQWPKLCSRPRSDNPGRPADSGAFVPQQPALATRDLGVALAARSQIDLYPRAVSCRKRHAQESLLFLTSVSCLQKCNSCRWLPSPPGQAGVGGR